jgi:indolepyruvate ferredoxin oxidoreductase alpha subunit
MAASSPDKVALLSGNEAIARGAVEAGVQVAAGYPGTPSTEIIEALASIAEHLGIYVEWSVNETVALSLAAGAAFTGVRSLAVMKHVGLNWASDPLMSVCLTGIKGGLLVVTADDPGAHSSQNEQDNRIYAYLANIPMLEPAGPQEAKDMVIEAFDLSEKIALPVMLRTTTRVSHVSENVRLGDIPRDRRQARFEKDFGRYYLAGKTPVRRHMWQLEQMKKAEEWSESSGFNRLENEGGHTCVITSGVSYCYVKEALALLNVTDVAVLKIGVIHPLPKSRITELMKSFDRVLVVEELEPVLEVQIRALAQITGGSLEISGKMSGDVPRCDELNTDSVLEVLSCFLRKELVREETENRLPQRLLTMCPGCPHRATSYALKEALRRVSSEYVVMGDIGCYGLAALPPLQIIDASLCMGTGIGLACGMTRGGLDLPVVAVIGDSTFFHAGMPQLLNAIYNNSKITLIIYDNRTTAMTGFQPHPGVGKTAMGKQSVVIKPEEICRGMGVHFVEVVDPHDLAKSINIIEKAIAFNGPSVVVARRLCAIVELKQKGKERPYQVDLSNCTGCGICISQFGCPSIIWKNEATAIDPSTCNGCGVCAQICPSGAIQRAKVVRYGV